MEVEPFGPRQDDLRAVMVAQAARGALDPKMRMTDVFPSLGGGARRQSRFQTIDEQRDACRAIFGLLGGRKVKAS